MRFSVLTIAASLGLAAAWPRLAATQDERDFVFTDEEGHLVLRFAGADELNDNQFEEIVNVQFSTMVHDRLRADVMFEAEPVDLQWADPAAARIERHVSNTGSEFSSVDVECRSASCRVVLEHVPTWRVSEHQVLMGAAQRVIQAFIEADPDSFEPVVLIAAHYQEPERPYIKVFLRRTANLAG